MFTELTELLQVMLLDFAGTKYTESQLKRVLMLAAFQVNQELSFDNDYLVNITQESITPDPTATATRDDAFINLVCIKGACIIDRGSAALAATQAISVKDGSSAIDLRGPLQGKLELLKHGWCKVYQDAKFEHELGTAPVAGAAITTPFRTYYNYLR